VSRLCGPGDSVLLIFAAANRDPEAFPDPDRFEFNRPQTVALGHGIHYCLGPPLAQREGRIALQTVFERWPAIHQAGELVYAIASTDVVCEFLVLSVAS
jgi:cytochrome P450